MLTFLGTKTFCFSLIKCVHCFCARVTFLFFWKSASRAKRLLEAAGVQILCLGQGAGFLPVSHRMWGILSGSSKEGRPASKAGGSGQGMERGGQDSGRRQTRPDTEPCGGKWPLKFLEFSTSHHELNKHSVLTLYK